MTGEMAPSPVREEIMGVLRRYIPSALDEPGVAIAKRKLCRRRCDPGRRREAVRVVAALRAALPGLHVSGWDERGERGIGFEAPLTYRDDLLDEDVELVDALGGEMDSLKGYASLLGPWCCLFCERDVHVRAHDTWAGRAVGAGPHAAELAAACGALGSLGYERVPFGEAMATVPDADLAFKAVGEASAYGCLFSELFDPAAVSQIYSELGNPDGSAIGFGRPERMLLMPEWRTPPLVGEAPLPWPAQAPADEVPPEGPDGPPRPSRPGRYNPLTLSAGAWRRLAADLAGEGSPAPLAPDYAATRAAEALSRALPGARVSLGGSGPGAGLHARLGSSDADWRCSERTDLLAWVSPSAPWCFLFCEREVTMSRTGTRLTDAVGAGPHAAAFAAACEALGSLGYERVPFGNAVAYVPGRAPTAEGAAGATVFNLLFDAGLDPAAVPWLETAQGTPDGADIPRGRSSHVALLEQCWVPPGLF